MATRPRRRAATVPTQATVLAARFHAAEARGTQQKFGSDKEIVCFRVESVPLRYASCLTQNLHRTMATPMSPLSG